jgi:hypothetical protein
MQHTALLGSLSYPQYVHKALSLRGLGCGKINLEMWNIFRIFIGTAGGLEGSDA